MDFDTRAFRRALGCFSTGVCVVTAQGQDGRPFGLTINSFSSLSLDPPLILWSLDRGSDTFADFAVTERFVLSVLRADQAEISARLARKAGHDLSGIATASAACGLPAIEGALAVFECDVWARHPGGDHEILVGRVTDFRSEPGGDGLTYFRSRYGVAAAPVEG